MIARICYKICYRDRSNVKKFRLECIGYKRHTTLFTVVTVDHIPAIIVYPIVPQTKF